MADLREWELPAYRQLLQFAGRSQEKIADYLTEKNNLAAFIPYFLSGGYASADALKNLGQYGFNRPDRNEGGDNYQSGRVNVMKDILDASQMTGYSIPYALGKAGVNLGKAGLKKGISAVADKINAPLGSASRREFMKKSAAVGAGSTVAVKLAEKLLAPKLEATAAPKIAEEVVEQVPKYKYNSLTEYLDHLKGQAEEQASIAASENGLSGRAAEDYIENNINTWFSWLAKKEEQTYNQAKDLVEEAKHIGGEQWESIPVFQQNHLDALNAFSPEAKAEMKTFKQKTNQMAKDWGDPRGSAEDSWVDWLANIDSPERLKETQTFLETIK